MKYNKIKLMKHKRNSHTWQNMLNINDLVYNSYLYKKIYHRTGFVTA